MDIMQVIDEIAKLKEKIATLVLEKQALEARVKDLEDGSSASGVYLDGCPDYAREYISTSNKEKDGE